MHASGAEVPLSFSASLPDEHGNVYVLGHGLEAISHADLASIKTMLTLSIPEGVALDTGLDTDENTALMLAAQAGREDLVRFLLSDEIAAILPEPVDLGVRDVRGRTAADIALAAGHPSIAALLSTRAAARSVSFIAPPETRTQQ